MKLFSLVVLPLVGARVVRTQQQVPIIGDLGDVEANTRIESLLDTTDEDAPVVGVHFTTSYAIASARYQNGTIRDLNKIVGDAEYVDLMSRWVNGQDGWIVAWYGLLRCCKTRLIATQPRVCSEYPVQ